MYQLPLFKNVRATLLEADTTHQIASVEPVPDFLEDTLYTGFNDYACFYKSGAVAVVNHVCEIQHTFSSQEEYIKYVQEQRIKAKAGEII